MVRYLSLDQTQAYAALKTLSMQPQQIDLSVQRIQTCWVPTQPLGFNFSATSITTSCLTALQSLAEEQQVIEKYTLLRGGAIMNVSENRSVDHHQLRVHENNSYTQEQVRLNQFISEVHSGQIKACNGQAFTHVVQVGIGGCEIGPKYVVQAMRYLKDPQLTPFFIANVDPYETEAVVRQIPLETTLWIVASKSGTTLETVANWHFIQKLALQQKLEPKMLHANSILLTSSEGKWQATFPFKQTFHIQEGIGGRFSVASVMGMALLGLCFGCEAVQQFLDGALAIDQLAQEPQAIQNPCLMAALVGVWERTFLGYPAKAIVPYSSALSELPNFVQQMDCESNGKHITRSGKQVLYPTSPVIFGCSGTNSQHSFFQMMHQGTEGIPIQFVAFRHASPQGCDQHQLLNANLIAQIVALACGKSAQDPNQEFLGNRPSTLVVADTLSPYSLGALAAFYENVAMFQGFIWNLNSFDQEGVQLGKQLTHQMLTKQAANHADLFETLGSLL